MKCLNVAWPVLMRTIHVMKKAKTTPSAIIQAAR